ncbi:hypothetical protein [Alcaligenes faecalis]|uniref:hypothetical protein n=1 Tax=Alcaligenes faecalis TaxID=511 RepID=UPI00214F902C|nr:hypothetical protein [Alcaligenes faecalis]MCR4144301.1 hypothetical protein [Alcaligenes faecalis]
MSKVTMPDPSIVSYQIDSTMRRMEIKSYDEKDMEAYAAAKVREALEEATEVAESCVCSCCCSDDQKFTAQDAAQRIRALIPSTPA